ncbi:FecR domain-containing protein [Pseudomonas asiatica]|nr:MULTISPECIES: FecR domain-containing protein [Pseudomonas]KIY38307.1 iron dicitrate transport regulator FecR [Pseudomonas sp. 10-1B]MEB6590420.1 FecR domain-containing protein [Pseudomonas asiatica]
MTDLCAMPAAQPISDLSDDALDWQVLLHSGNASTADQARYRRWCALSPAHAEAAREAEALWLDIGHTPTAQATAAVPARRKRHWAAGVAASLVLLAAAVAGWQQAPVLLADYHTGLGERQVITLADGTRVTLNSASALSVAFSERERRVVLDAGEALFETTDEPRPFVVDTAGGSVQGSAATFSVRRDGRVVLARGEAKVGEQQLTVAPDAGAQTAWQRGKLIFNGKPLGQVLAELERYRHGRIVLSDSKLAAMEVSGVFDLDEPEALLRTLEQRYGLKVTYLPWLAVVY